MKGEKLSQPSPVTDMDPCEHRWLTEGRTFCLKDDGRTKSVSTGGDYFVCEVHQPRPAPDVPPFEFPQNRPLEPRAGYPTPGMFQDWRKPLVMLAAVLGTWGVIGLIVWRVWR